MKALISPDEKVISYDGIELGQRIAQASEEIFEVSLPLFWIDWTNIPENAVLTEWYYKDGNFFQKPIPPEE